MCSPISKLLHGPCFRHHFSLSKNRHIFKVILEGILTLACSKLLWIIYIFCSRYCYIVIEHFSAVFLLLGNIDQSVSNGGNPGGIQGRTYNTIEYFAIHVLVCNRMRVLMAHAFSDKFILY